MNHAAEVRLWDLRVGSVALEDDAVRAVSRAMISSPRRESPLMASS